MVLQELGDPSTEEGRPPAGTVLILHLDTRLNVATVRCEDIEVHHFPSMLPSQFRISGIGMFCAQEILQCYNLDSYSLKTAAM